MPFKSWQSYWRFEQKVLHNQRYIYDDEIIEFLETVSQTMKSRERIIKKDSIVWRSQLGSASRPMFKDDEYVSDEPCPHFPERMVPLEYSASEGRVNPKGIPYLYLATDKETAMGEARPWVGAEISVAQFKLLREQKIVDCSVHHGSGEPFFFNIDNANFYEPDDAEKEKAVWTHIDKAFSRPAAENNNKAQYAPTQIIAELFKNKGYDGIAYKSSLGKGHNIALFDLKTAELINCSLFEAKEISFKLSQAGNPYFATKKEGDIEGEGSRNNENTSK